jgi:hypothetical protein
MFEDLNHDPDCSCSRLYQPGCGGCIAPIDGRRSGFAGDRLAVAMPDGHPHGAIEQDRRRHSHSGLADKSFAQSQYGSRAFAATRDDPHRDRMTMKTPTALVTAALVAAIILAMSFLIAAGTRGEETPLLNAPSYDHS